MVKNKEDLFKLRKGVFKEVKITQHENGSMDLILPQYDEATLREMLPPVSVITITKNRGMFAGVMLYNWVNFKYPREKLEWIILDDSDENYEYPLSDYIPKDDPNIRYVKLDRHYPIPEKRNKGVELAKYDYIVHMDDDDYYFPDSILAKIRVMLEYKCSGVLSVPIGIYDMMERSSLCYYWGTKGLNTNDISEASIAYTKDYWRRNPFCGIKGLNEGRSFINKHFDKWVNIHFLFNTISITHTHNVTGHGRRFINDNKLTSVKTGNFEEVFPEDFNTLLNNIRKMLVEKYQKISK